MAHKMDPNKPGVVIYFEPLQKVANKLDDARLGQLFRYILNFASPETETDPVIEDETLAYIWDFVRTLVVRDDKTFSKKSRGKQYSAFCRYAKENGCDKPPLSREQWEEQGAPTFLQWKATQTDANAYVAYNAMQCMPISTATSTSLSNSNSLSQSASGSDAASAEADGVPAVAGADTDANDDGENEKITPYEIPTLEQVKRYAKENDLRYTNPEYYHNYYSSGGWTTRDGKRIRDWRANLRNWNEKDRQRNAEASPWATNDSDDVVKYARALKRKREEKRKQ